MRRSIRRQVPSCWVSLLTLFIILVLVTSASAECAWVLWSSDYAADSFSTRDECREEAARRTQKHTEEMQKIPPAETMKRLLLATTFRCLPDTVDPRGSKGK